MKQVFKHFVPCVVLCFKDIYKTSQSGNESFTFHEITPRATFSTKSFPPAPPPTSAQSTGDQIDSGIKSVVSRL